MIHRLPQIRRFFPDFNKREITENHFWRVVKKENIYVDFWHLGFGVKGFYGVNNKYKVSRKYIVIESELLGTNWLPTALHELFHHILHTPQTALHVYFSYENKVVEQDNEADNFVLIALIPLPLLIELSETASDRRCEFSTYDLIRRKAIFDKYGV